MRIPAAALQNVTTRLETAANEGDETNAQETLKTTNVSPRSGRKMPTIPNVSSKDVRIERRRANFTRIFDFSWSKGRRRWRRKLRRREKGWKTYAPPRRVFCRS